MSSSAREYSAGNVLFREGEPGQEMFVIQSGVVQVTKRVAGAEKPLATLGRGEFVGEMAILTGKPRTATATVLEHARCLVIDARTLEQMIVQSPEIAVRLVQKLARRLHAADELVQILMNPDPKARILLGLKRHAETFGTQTPSGIEIHVTPADLALEVGTDEVDAAEVFARLTRLKIVSEGDGGSIYVTDVGWLMEFLEFLDIAREFEVS